MLCRGKGCGGFVWGCGGKGVGELGDYLDSLWVCSVEGWVFVYRGGWLRVGCVCCGYVWGLVYR